MIIRLRSKEGTCRVEIDTSSDTISTLIQKGLSSLPLNETANQIKPEDCFLSTDFEGKQPLTANDLQSLKHGEMLFLQLPRSYQTTTNSTNQSATNRKEDEIDLLLEKRQGMISRPKNELLCRHSSNAMCEHCLPLEPFDEGFGEANRIKHLSFHSYLRKLGLESEPTSSGQCKKFGSFSHALEEPDFIPAKCPFHPANGMCSKCQPSAITLQTQPFRMVDHVEFQSPEIVEGFIDWWRKTAYQRFGVLYGYYAPYEAVPLGIKAVVVAVWEPAQDCSIDGFELMEFGKPPEEVEVHDSCAKPMQVLAEACGLRPVGMIFTDLQDSGKKDGSVLCKRNASTYFVTGYEVMFSAHFQNAFPSPSRHSKSGAFGSKWVSVVVSGDENGAISLFAYQVSNVCTGMVNASLIQSTSEANLVCVPSPTSEAATIKPKYIPQVFYRWKNEYGIMVQKAADPTFPVDYLIVSLTHGFPTAESRQSSTMFDNSAIGEGGFPICNRPELPLKPSLEAVSRYFSFRGGGKQGESLKLVDFSNFNLLLFFGCCGLFDDEHLLLLYRAVSEKNEAFFELFLSSSSWLSFLMLLEEAAEANENRQQNSQFGSSSEGRGALKRGESVAWTCAQCTFINYGNGQDCEMCSLPR